MRTWPRQPKAWQHRHTTGPAPPPPADQGSPMRARPVCENSTLHTPARPVRPSGPNRGCGAQLGPWRLSNHHGAGQPSAWQERAAKRAAGRYLSTPQHHPCSTSAPAQGATTQGPTDKTATPPTHKSRAPEEHHQDNSHTTQHTIHRHLGCSATMHTREMPALVKPR